MNSIERSLPHKISQYLSEVSIDENAHFIVALSGGPDSTALLHALWNIKDTSGYTLSAAYVNHGMRREQELIEDDRFVHDLTSSLGVKLHQKKIASGEIENIASTQGRSLEEVAREIRYDFFYSLFPQYPNPYIVLGHNLDDQLETLISRFFQGAGISGLKGIPRKNVSILRPLIDCRKDEVFHYLKTVNQGWRTDPTNSENNYQRNRIRNTLIPVIREIFPGYESSLLSQRDRFFELDELIEKKADSAGGSYSKDKCEVPLDSFNESDKFVRLNILYKMFDTVYRGGVQGFRVPSGFFNPLIDVQLGKGKTFANAHGVKIHSDDESLIMIPINDFEKGYQVYLKDPVSIIPGKYIIGINGSEGTAIPVMKGSPLIFRSATPGDYIELDNGKKPLKDVFKRWGIEDALLSPIPVLEDSEGIAALLGAIEGYENLTRKKKIITSQKFNILYLEVGRE